MDMNVIKILYTFNSIAVTALGLLINLAEPYLPVEIQNLYRYGRYAAKGESSLPIPTLEFPKRWFKHFYEFAAPLATYILFIAFWTYLGYGGVPKYICKILDILLGDRRMILVSSEHAALALVLITIQCWKRFYETHYVSIFSNGKIHLGHYVNGFLHYAAILTAIIGESEGFSESSEPTINWRRLTYIDYSCTVVFLWASYQQLKCNLILVNLRKNKKGEVVTLEHKVPKGELFDYISSPLQLTEILMYFMLTLILWKSSTYHYLFVWVLVNQSATGLAGHQWYAETFKEYPKERRALIPGIL